MPNKPLASQKPNGRPAFQPSKENRNLVTVLRGAGTAPEVIARLLKISERTLYAHFPDELAHGKAEVVARIGSSLVQKALKGDNSSAQYYLSRNGGAAWADKQKIEHSGPDGAVLPSVVIQVTDPIEAARIYQRLINGD